MDDGDYIGNVCRFAVDLVDGSGPDAQTREMYREHGVRLPDASELAPLLPLLDAALAAVADHEPGARPLGPVTRLLEAYPPTLALSDHDGATHLHFARDGEEPVAFTGRTVGAALAYALTGDVPVALGRCAADGCRRYFVDSSRNRSRRFCTNACASRTTVSAYRARRRTPAGA